MRIKGISILLCLKGSIDIDVNLTRHTVEENDLFVINPDSVVSIKHVDTEGLDAYLFMISPEFIRDINLDLNVLHSHDFRRHTSPVMKLEKSDMVLMRHYFDLLHFNTVANPDEIYVRSISRCLIASALYQMFQFAHKYNASHPGNPNATRQSSYVRDFMQLVHTHYRSERSVGFYADKLFISPKYLSLIIKRSTGKSAAEWIGNFVILEAKNLLRYSGKNIQQIAYELNFTNQSAFGKYFKHLTGMSPSEFQRS